ncbi:hypothetical protein [Halostagnicola bangensis]
MSENIDSVPEENNPESGDSVDALEEQYQVNKVLQSETDIQAEIVAAGWTDELNTDRTADICLQLSVPGTTEYFVFIKRLADQRYGGDFVELCQRLGHPPQKDLSVLRGTTVSTEIEQGSKHEFVILHDGESRIRTRVIDKDTVPTLQPTLPDDLAMSLSRLYTYRLANPGETGEQVQVTDLDVVDGELVLHLERRWGTITVPVEDGPGDETPYNRLVENLGQGSVKEIEGTVIHTVHTEDIEDPINGRFSDLDRENIETMYGDFLLEVEDHAGKWAVFASEPKRSGSIFALPGLVGGGALLLIGLLLANLWTGVLGVVVLLFTFAYFGD